MSQEALSNDKTRLLALDALKGFNGAPFTLADFVAKSGLAPYQAEVLLNNLVTEYSSDIDVDEQGNALYRFDASLAAREDIVAADKARRRRETLRRVGRTFMKGMTVAVVVIYFIVYMVLLIAALAAISSKKDENNRSRSNDSGGGFFIHFVRWSFWSNPGYGTYHTGRSRRQRREWNRKVEAQIREGKDPYRVDVEQATYKPGTLDKTWFFLFGEKAIERTPLEKEKELLTYMRAKRGFITNADIIALLGVTYEEADKIGTRLVAAYEGELDITDEGVSIYRFPNLMLSGAPEVADSAATLAYGWQYYEREEILRKHPAILIPLMNVANIIMGFVVPPLASENLGLEGPEIDFILIYFPLAFSFLFFGLGIRQMIRRGARGNEILLRNLRLGTMRVLMRERRRLVFPADIGKLKLTNEISREKIMKKLPELARELNAELEGASDRQVLNPERILNELVTVERLRQRAPSTQKVGRTVFSSRDDVAGANAIGEVETQQEKPKFSSVDDEIAALEKELSNS